MINNYDTFRRSLIAHLILKSMKPIQKNMLGWLMDCMSVTACWCSCFPEPQHDMFCHPHPERVVYDPHTPLAIHDQKTQKKKKKQWNSSKHLKKHRDSKNRHSNTNPWYYCHIWKSYHFITWWLFEHVIAPLKRPLLVYGCRMATDLDTSKGRCLWHRPNAASWSGLVRQVLSCLGCLSENHGNTHEKFSMKKWHVPWKSSP